MEIRKVTPEDDFEAIGEIYVKSWQAGYRGLVPQDYLDSLSADRWSARLAEMEFGAFVAVENGKYIGTTAYCPARDENMPGWGEVISIYLLPEYFGGGCAKPLLEAALTALRASSFDKAYLWVLTGNARARRFYEKCGLRPSSDKAVLQIGGKDLEETRYLYLPDSGVRK